MTAECAPAPASLEHPFIPEWSGLIEGWSRTYVARHCWRVVREMEADDLMQEAFLVFQKCASKWHSAWIAKTDTTFASKGWKPERGAFVFLYQRSLANRFTDLTNRYMRQAKRRSTSIADVDGDEIDLLERAVASLSTIDEVFIRELIDEIPADCRELAAQILQEYSWKTMTENGVRETRRQALARSSRLPLTELDAAQKRLEKWARKRFLR